MRGVGQDYGRERLLSALAAKMASNRAPALRVTKIFIGSSFPWIIYKTQTVSSGFMRSGPCPTRSPQKSEESPCLADIIHALRIDVHFSTTQTYTAFSTGNT